MPFNQVRAAVILGASRPAQLTENLAALDVVPKLTAGVLERAAAWLALELVQNGWDLLELVRERASLEDVFRSLTLETDREALSA